MLRLRPYKPNDAQTILSWCKDETTFRKWTSDRYDHFPITAEDMNRKYIDNNGDCAETDNFYPMTAFDEESIVGHLIMRYTDKEKKTLRFGFVIVDDSKRGKGYGKEMISLSLRYAFEIFKADKVTIGVFDNNAPAYSCYKSAGFKDVETEENICELFGEKWIIKELEATKADYEQASRFPEEFKAKKKTFLQIAKKLNEKFKVTPLLFGSLGLEQRLQTNLNADDIDVLIPEMFLKEKWSDIVETMAENGYSLYDTHEHAFKNSDLSIAFASIENLVPFAGIELAKIPIVAEMDVQYYLLDLQDYLKVYTASSKDGYRRDIKNKNDIQKINLINQALSKTAVND